MSLVTTTSWHRASFDRFLRERLPQLLAARLPLNGYRVEARGDYTCRVTITLATGKGELEVAYEKIPQPDAEGVFEVGGEKFVVHPIASSDTLETAEIRCVGEQLDALFAAQLGDGNSNLPWDEVLLRAWLPLDTWIQEFVQRADPLDTTNWLSRKTALRRLFLPNRTRVIAPGHFGRTCPIETPEGPNIGKFLVVAVGATIEDGKLVIVDDRPAGTFGLCASMIPFIEHSEGCRLLMGANMMRQWIRPPDPEPAYVQTGNEPDEADFWCGRNLLTAYVSWGADTHEDALVVSESAAKRLGYPAPLEPGDKLSNRHGSKGVISRILPDDEMPHLPDGTPVEIAFSFAGLISRINFGQIREALLGRIARQEGSPACAPSFAAPQEPELRERLAKAGLNPTGREMLTLGHNGKPLARPSMVGYVYWGKLTHRAATKLHAAVAPWKTSELEGIDRDDVGEPPIPIMTKGQQASDLEYYALRDARAFETIREQFNTRAEARPDANTLAQRAAQDTIAQAPPPAPQFAALTRNLQTLGIRTILEADRLRFAFEPGGGETLTLAQAVPHPWLIERFLTEVGAQPESAEYRAITEANARLQRLLDSDAPESLRRKAHDDLTARVREYADALIVPETVRFDARVLFSGRTVVAPGADLRPDQVGLAEEIAWTLFGPLVVRELGGKEDEVRKRSAKAAETLDAIMARSWVIVHRAPTLGPNNFVAFHPVRDPGRVIRLHPLINNMMDADYDGDQVAVFLPLTEAGQREAGEKLSVVAHLKRDPDLLRGMIAWHAGRWGLASHSLTPEGKAEIEGILGVPVTTPNGILTGDTLLEALEAVREREGIERMLDGMDRLQRLGFQVAKESGASMSPFIGETVAHPPQPPLDDGPAWERYVAALIEQMLSRTDYADNDIGHFLLSIKSGARGNGRLLNWFAGAAGVFTNVHGEQVVLPHGLRDGMTPAEFFAVVFGSREGQARHILVDWEQMESRVRQENGPRGLSVLARAMRSAYPGIVLARAAASGESDPLTEPDVRLFIGLPTG